MLENGRPDIHGPTVSIGKDNLLGPITDGVVPEPKPIKATEIATSYHD